MKQSSYPYVTIQKEQSIFFHDP